MIKADREPAIFYVKLRQNKIRQSMESSSTTEYNTQFRVACSIKSEGKEHSSKLRVATVTATATATATVAATATATATAASAAVNKTVD